MTFLWEHDCTREKAVSRIILSNRLSFLFIPRRERLKGFLSSGTLFRANWRNRQERLNNRERGTRHVPRNAVLDFRSDTLLVSHVPQQLLSGKSKPSTELVILPDHPLLVSMSGRKVKFSGFSYYRQNYSFRGCPPFVSPIAYQKCRAREPSR